MRDEKAARKGKEENAGGKDRLSVFPAKNQLPDPSVSPQGSLSLVLGVPSIWRKVASTGRDERAVASGLDHLTLHIIL